MFNLDGRTHGLPRWHEFWQLYLTLGFVLLRLLRSHSRRIRCQLLRQILGTQLILVCGWTVLFGWLVDAESVFLDSHGLLLDLFVYHAY